MNKRIRKKVMKRAWANLRKRMSEPDFWKRAEPTGWASASDGATWTIVTTTEAYRAKEHTDA